MRLVGWTAVAGGIVIAGVLIFVPEWTSFPPNAQQVGPSPTSMILFKSGQKVEPIPQSPPKITPVSAEQVAMVSGGYKNVKVLGDLPPDKFMQLQQAITQWVSPQQGCAFCHTQGDWSSDAKPQKIAARLMLQMTRDINANWKNHIAPAGVTCFSCHRGQPIPAETWFPQPSPPDRAWVAKQENWSEGADTVRKFFPDASWAEYYLASEPISGQSLTALPSGQVHSAVVVKRIYEMMMQMSDGMGINCGYCHNSRAFFDWSQSTPQRWIAHYAIEQLRHANNDYMVKLGEQIPMTRERVNQTNIPTLPARESGILEGNGLLVCATCHNAQPKPMGGANVIQDWPSLVAPASSKQAEK